MIVPWAPVEIIDSIGSVLALLLAIGCLQQAWGWYRVRRDDIFRHYILLFTLAIVVFAVSRSCGHLIKQILILSGREHIWHILSPFSGAINTATFFIIFAFSLYYQRVKIIHIKLEDYKNNLEEMVALRTAELEETNFSLENEVTERQAIQKALETERERLAVTLRSIGDGVITTDIEGRIILLNRISEQLTGWTQEEAAGHPIEEVFNIIDELTRTPRENPVPKVLKHGQIVALANHTTLIDRNGMERSIADSGAPIRDRKSRIIGVVLVFRDVTETKRLNEELNKAQKLESVGVLAGGIAHDFNNILTAIMGNLNLAQHLMNPEDKVYTLLEAADKASRRAKSLTQQLLTFAKGGNPVKKTANLGQIIRETADFVLHGSSVQCHYDIPDDLWLVDLDPGQMSQVIQNLIINARQAMNAGGRIKIKSENISTPAAEMFPVLNPEGKYIKTTINDDGPGIPAGIIEQIFDPYFTTKEKGSGLGLAISHSIISKHGGFIKADSNKSGTVFTIYLPVTTGETSHNLPSITHSPIKPAAGELIMIMDDEKMIRDIAKMMLETNGFEVITAKDGVEAIKIYQQHQKARKTVSAIIMDLTIPGGMGGKEAVTRILALDPQARIIASSGYSNDPVMTDFHSYGFCAAITKPYLINDLLLTITQALS